MITEKKSKELVQSLFKQYNINCYWTKDRYDEVDIVTEAGWLVEVKARRTDAEAFMRYDQEGFILEHSKYKALSAQKDSRYINVFELNGNTYLLIWFIDFIKPSVASKQCKTTTDFGNNSYREKDIIYVKSEQASIHMLDGSKFTHLTHKQFINNIC